MVKKELLSKILKRSGPMFADDLESHRAQIDACIRGARIMVIGAGGEVKVERNYKGAKFRGYDPDFFQIIYKGCF